jgi:hypothetical protein
MFNYLEDDIMRVKQTKEGMEEEMPNPYDKI